ncbi:hypothetical protein COCOBI_04-6610 [Coccomyxa sp. Obi]|nr:hypothetical protein COCOBI_04-6610 [Coccomyxa sp. Obi]
MNGVQQLSSVDNILGSYHRAIQKHVQYHLGAGEETFQGLHAADFADASRCNPMNKDGDTPSAAATGAQPMQWPWWLFYPPPPPPPPLPPFLCPPFRLLPAEDAQWHHGMW